MATHDPRTLIFESLAFLANQSLKHVRPVPKPVVEEAAELFPLSNRMLAKQQDTLRFVTTKDGSDPSPRQPLFNLSALVNAVGEVCER